MNKPTAIIVGLGFVALIGGLVAVNAIDPVTRMTDSIPSQTVEITNNKPSKTLYEDSGIGVSFSYDEERYHLEIRPSSSDEHVRTIILTDIDAYQELINSDVPREGPPAITIHVYRNQNKQWPRTWADAHPEISMIEQLRSEVSDTVIGGANAIRYTSDGLYPTDSVLVAHGSYVYLFSAAYLDLDSPTKRDFEPLVRSVTFIPEAE